MRAGQLTALTLVFTAALVACSNGTGPEDLNLSGTWNYSATIEQDQEDCRIENAPMTVLQDGSVLSGDLDVGSIQCGDLVCEGDHTLEDVPLESGRHREDGSLEFTAHFLDHEGTATRDRMEGSLVSERVELSCALEGGGSGVIIIEGGGGTWEATR